MLNGKSRLILLLTSSLIFIPLTMSGLSLFEAADNGNIAFIRSYVKSGKNIKAAGGWTALLFASQYNNNEMAKLMIDAKADVNNKCVGFNHYKNEYVKMTALDFTENTYAPGNIKLLIGAGAAEDIYSAAIIDDTNFIKSYIKVGGDLNIRNMDGKTPLIFAVEHNKTDFARLFISGGADLTVFDIYNQTALYLAVRMPALDSRLSTFDS
jgi:ankyrin repeat protein